MYVNIIIYSNKLLLFVWSTLNKEKKKKNRLHHRLFHYHLYEGPEAFLKTDAVKA